ncbi:hypothetical protein J2W68_001440 [Luteimonas terrae]|uniref:Uncharacterized protein n=1 Tax=Luteimonas terrae TaxID=1530191 RepID=A0ABU1XVD1_9GAMM|nr:hypothetical protein [Luteimonas terrae]
MIIDRSGPPLEHFAAFALAFAMGVLAVGRGTLFSVLRD